MPVHITVTRGKCQGNIHEIGQEFIVDHTTPEGICLGTVTLVQGKMKVA